MKKMTKLVALLLVLVMSVTMLQGCKKDEDKTKTNTPTATATTDAPVTETTEEPVEDPSVAVYDAIEDGASITVWEAGGAHGEFMQEAAKQFSEKYGVEVTYEEVGHTETVTKLILDGPAGVGADVYASPHDKMGEVFANGLALANDAAGYADKFLEVSTKVGMGEDGKLYAYPLSFETYALFYNKDLVATAPTTWDEVIAFAETFNDAANNKFAAMWEAANAYYGFAFLSSVGPLFGENGTDKTQLLTDTDAAVKAMQYYQTLRSKVFNVPAADTSYDAMMTAFKEGKTAMILNGPWAIKEIQDAGVNFGIAPFPKLEGGVTPLTFSGIRVLHVSSYSKYPNAAKAFAYFATVDLAELRVEMTGDVPVLKGLDIDDEYRLAIQAAGENAFPMPSIPAMSAYWSVMGGVYTNIWDGKDVVAELNGATSALKSQIE